MAQTKKIKIFTHNYLYVNIPAKHQNPKRNKLWAGIVYIAQLLFNFCFAVGNFLISIFTNAIKFVKNEITSTAVSLEKRLTILLHKDFLKSLGFFLIICILGASLFQSAHILALGLSLKDRIVNSAFLGSNNLNKAKTALENQNLGEAQNKFLSAYQNFQNGQKEMDSTGQLISNLLNVFPQKRDAQRLLTAASSLAQAGNELVNFYKVAGDLQISSEGVSSKNNQNGELFTALGEGLKQIKEHLNSAQDQISKINPKSLPAERQQEFSDIQNKTAVLNKTFNDFEQLFSIITNLIGGQKKVLIFFENNNELRATGGFPGTFGQLTLNNGKIEKMNVSSIYDLDGQLKENIIPPSPMFNLNSRWFLRDSNWFANFPESAKKMTSFYEKEGGETPDIIIAMTPQLILDLLKITGPIRLPKYNLTLDEQNFVEQTQVVSTMSNDLPENKPKQILADLVPLLLQRLSQLKPEESAQILVALGKNLSSKQIVFYSRDQVNQHNLASFNWTGEILNSDRDYLSIVSSNLGATKSDLAIKQEIKLSSAIDPKGDIINELTIIRSNSLPKLSQTFNNSFLRIFVPEGSELISNSGFDIVDPGISGRADYKNDPDVLTWEKNSVKDVVTETLIGREAGKTFFGNWVNLQGGETRTIKIKYRLPFKLKNIDRFSLLLQKQMGTPDQNFSYNLNYVGKTLEWENFEPVQSNSSSVSTEAVLNKDYFFGTVLKIR